VASLPKGKNKFLKQNKTIISRKNIEIVIIWQDTIRFNQNDKRYVTAY
jgi:hypothetical protein